LIGSHNNTNAFNNPKMAGFILVMLLFFAGVPVGMAQERNGIGQEENYKAQDELNSNTDNPLNNGPATAIKEREIGRDSVASKPSLGVNPKVDSAAPKKEEAEDETLSYNVLYFIIQKFKVSDMLN
jgi:hypothetical protein